jgi:hypothetical protein
VSLALSDHASCRATEQSEICGFFRREVAQNRWNLSAKISAASIVIPLQVFSMLRGQRDHCGERLGDTAEAGGGENFPPKIIVYLGIRAGKVPSGGSISK